MDNTKNIIEKLKEYVEGVKQFDGDLFTDYISRNPIKEVDDILDVLKETDVVYDVNQSGEINVDNSAGRSIKPSSSSQSYKVFKYSILSLVN